MKQKKGLAIVIGVLFALMLIIGQTTSFIIDYQWFKEVGYLNVFFTEMKWRLIVFIPSLIILFILIDLYIKYLKKNYLRLSDQIIDKATKKKQARMINLISLGVSFLGAMAFSGAFWYRILEFMNATDFGIVDPIFKKDAGYYIFKMPLLQTILVMLIGLIILMIFLTLIFYTVIRYTEETYDQSSNIRYMFKDKDNPKVRFIARQLAVMGALFLLVLAGIFYIKCQTLVYSNRGVAVGASYTDVHVTLPMYRVIAIFCVIAAVIVAIAIVKKKIKWILFTAGFIVVLMISETLISGAVEQFIVAPNARDKEMPYLTYNIDLTRKAFGIDKIEEKPFDVTNDLKPEDLEQNKQTIDNIRITEFPQSLEVYNQIQAIRNYYVFNDVDIDRYNIDGNLRQVFIAARELDNSSREPRFQTWQNKHLFYTHGYGAVMSYTNEVTPTGLPQYILKDIPVVESEDSVKLDKPQLYFGELPYEYIIVNAKSNEIDYPTGNENKENRYDGKAGIQLNGLNKLLYAWNYKDINFLLSNDITSSSRIVLHRNIMDRVRKIAPFINYDQDPYLVSANGRMYWVVDAYTYTDKFPFSENYRGINYIRNSIKVIVDAYDGTVDFYISDKTDAIAKTISKMYGNIFKDMSEMPEELKAHMRYSEDVFSLQAKVYEKYHMSNPSTFYNSQDLWSIAKYKADNGEYSSSKPIYQIMKLPGEDKEEFILTIPYTVANKQNMVSWLAVRMDQDLGNMVVVKFPEDKGIYGPEQFNSKLNTDTDISKNLTLWGQQGSQVILGDTSIIPIDNSLLYVKPMYLKSQGQKTLPELKKVILQYGDRLVMEDTVQKGLDKLFGTNNNTGTQQPPETVQPPQDQQTPDMQPSTDKDGLIRQAADLFDKAKAAQTQGDWAAYGDYLKQLETIINQLNSLTAKN